MIPLKTMMMVMVMVTGILEWTEQSTFRFLGPDHAKGARKVLCVLQLFTSERKVGGSSRKCQERASGPDEQQVNILVYRGSSTQGRRRLIMRV